MHRIASLSSGYIVWLPLGYHFVLYDGIVLGDVNKVRSISLEKKCNSNGVDFYGTGVSM